MIIRKHTDVLAILRSLYKQEHRILCYVEFLLIFFAIRKKDPV